jgi:VanZ family protein
MTKDGAAGRPGSLVIGHWWVIGHSLLFALLLALWTWKLVSPNPAPEVVRAKLAELDLAFAVAKALHLSGYAFLAVLAGTLPVPRHWRAFLVGLLVLHGAATEVAQTFVPNRTGKASDVLIDWIGVALGALGARLWNRRESRP